MQAPPGGPVRKEPPVVLTTEPESGAVNVTARGVTFEFDAIVNDRGPGGDLSRLVLLSPHDEETSVRWRRDRIEVRAKRGFRPGTAYSVTLLPGFQDLNGNATKSATTITFSTGPTIPAFAVHGRVFDWPTERVAAGALIEVVRRSDSLPYVGVSDTAGMFVVGPLEQGTYHVRAMLDANRNRALDPNEAWDTLGVQVTAESPFVELRAVARDTVGPRLLTVMVRDSVTIDAAFDRFLDPAVPIAPSSFRVVQADSTPVTVTEVLTASQFAARRAARDSAARADTTQRDRPAPRPTAASAPRPSLPAPAQSIVLLVDPTAPLRIGVSYRVTALDARGLLGAPRTSERVVTVARPDSTRAAPRPAPSATIRPPERTP